MFTGQGQTAADSYSVCTAVFPGMAAPNAIAKPAIQPMLDPPPTLLTHRHNDCLAHALSHDCDHCRRLKMSKTGWREVGGCGADRARVALMGMIERAVAKLPARLFLASAPSATLRWSRPLNLRCARCARGRVGYRFRRRNAPASSCLSWMVRNGEGFRTPAANERHAAKGRCPEPSHEQTRGWRSERDWRRRYGDLPAATGRHRSARDPIGQLVG